MRIIVTEYEVFTQPKVGGKRWHKRWQVGIRGFETMAEAQEFKERIERLMQSERAESKGCAA